MNVTIDIDDIETPHEYNKGEWRSRAKCSGLPPDIFFPERGQNTSITVKKMCIDCPVRTECLEFAVLSNQQYGIWAGTSVKARRKLRRQYIIDNGLHLTPITPTETTNPSEEEAAE